MRAGNSRSCAVEIVLAGVAGGPAWAPDDNPYLAV
jgi:hypothetical protein